MIRSLVVALAGTWPGTGRPASLRSALARVLLALVLAAPAPARAQDGDGDITTSDVLPWNGFDMEFTTLEYGFGLLVDYATYYQSDDAEEQVRPVPRFVLRDLRGLLRGRFRGGWGVTWQTGIMYDQPSNTLRFRQTGLRIPLPGPWGAVFVGRTKEGVSLNKVTVGYYGWTMERYAFSDAFLPILNDGVKWYGYAPRLNLIWTVGAFTDWLGHIETYSKDDDVVAARVAWVSTSADPDGRVVHVGASARFAHPADGALRLRSRPESFGAGFFVDTGDFPTSATRMFGGEAYLRTGRWFAGSEYSFAQAESAEADDPWFHGGDVFVSRLFGRATRRYNPSAGGHFGNVIPASTMNDGGAGVWEAVLRLSYVDLTEGPIEGGTFWRISPTLNWHLTAHVRAELGYGYGALDRFGSTGHTHFMQTRWQLQF